MCDNGGANLDGGAIMDSDQIWPRRFDNGIITNPNILPDFYSPPAVEPDAPAGCARHMTSQHLQKPVFQPEKKGLVLTFRHFHILSKDKRQDEVLHRSLRRNEAGQPDHDAISSAK